MGNWVHLFVSRRWRWATLLVMVGVVVLIRLGIWQLERLEERRTSNSALAAQLAQSAITLTGEENTADLLAMKDRTVAAAGEFDYDHQFTILLQTWEGRTGFYLVTPLRLNEEIAILVNRGWLPQVELVNLRQFDLPNPVTLEGYIALSQVPQYGERETSQTTFQPEQYRIDIEILQAQLPYTLLPIFIQQAPQSGESSLPYRLKHEIDLSEGSHLSYAIQWFSFALLLGGGYFYYVRQHHSKAMNS